MKLAINNQVNESLLTETSEKDLYNNLRSMESEIKVLLDKKDYVTALQNMIKIKPSVDKFFETVMVMAEDEKLKLNRLALLKYASTIFFQLLDFSLLQV